MPGVLVPAGRSATSVPVATVRGYGRLDLALRADYREPLALVRGEIGFESIRGHGLLSDGSSVQERSARQRHTQCPPGSIFTPRAPTGHNAFESIKARESPEITTY